MRLGPFEDNGRRIPVVHVRADFQGIPGCHVFHGGPGRVIFKNGVVAEKSGTEAKTQEGGKTDEAFYVAHRLMYGEAVAVAEKAFLLDVEAGHKVYALSDHDLLPSVYSAEASAWAPASPRIADS